MAIGQTTHHRIFHDFEIAGMRLPSIGGSTQAMPVEEPPVKPAPTKPKPQVDPEPNTVPARPPVREPDVTPMPRPPSTCPVGPSRNSY